MRYFIIYLAICSMLVLPNRTIAETTVINILHLNDTHSNLLPGGERDQNLKSNYGGLARAASIIGMEKAKDSETIVLHAGDLFIGDLMWYLNGFGIPELTILKQLGLNAITIGNHEFDAGSSTLAGILQFAKQNELLQDLPFLSANMLNMDEEVGLWLRSMVQDTTTIVAKGKKVGIFGLTSPVANMTSLPLPEIFIGSDFITHSERCIKALKESGCGIIICLSHLGIKLDREIAAQVNGIDLIIGAHDHILTTTEVKVNNTVIVQAGAFYQHIGKVEVTIENDKIISILPNLIELDENIPEEPTTAEFLNEIIDDLEEQGKMLFNTTIAVCSENFSEKENEPLKAGYKGTDVGCLIADAFRAWGNTDIGFTTSGLSAQPLYKGPITGNDIARMLGYGINETSLIGYNMAKFKLKGIDLFKGILYCLNVVAKEGDDEFLPQVSGMQITYYTKDVNVYEIKVGGNPLDFEKEYSLSTSYFVYQLLDFVYKELGYTESPMTDAETVVNISDFQILLNYAKTVQQLTPNPIDRQRVIAPVREQLNSSNFALIDLYPNPTSDYLNIYLNDQINGSIRIEIFDNLGQKVSQNNDFWESDPNNNIQLNVSEIKNGSYFLKVINNKKVYFGKFVISK